MANIHDVAKRAGVSTASVSYALSGKDGISEQTRAKILAIADEMGYVPNELAQGLLKNRTGVFGVVLPDISNTYSANFIKYLEKYAAEHDRYIIIGCTLGSTQKENQIVKSFIGKKVDGLIISPGNYDSSYNALTEYMHKRKTPFVMANLSFPEIKCNYVVPDLEEGAYMITKHVLSKGHRDLVFMGGMQKHYYTEVRLGGFLRALREHSGTSADGEYIECGEEYSFAEGCDNVKKLLERPRLPQAVIAVNDLVAYGIIAGLKEKGILVPRDISVTGFDHASIPVPTDYRLTTVNIPLEEMASMCVDILLKAKNSKTYWHTILKPDIIIGDTVI